MHNNNKINNLKNNNNNKNKNKKVMTRARADNSGMEWQ